MRERPLVLFSHEVLVEGYGAGVESRFGWSTSFELNDALAHRLRPCELRAWSDDTDRDGVPEELHFALPTVKGSEGFNYINSEGFAYEIEEANRCLRDGQTESAAVPAVFNRRLLSIIDKARAQLREGV